MTECETRTCSGPVTAAPRTGGCSETFSARWDGCPSSRAWQTLASCNPPAAASPALPSHPAWRHCIRWAPWPRAILSVRIYCRVKSNDTPSVLSAILVKHTAIAQVNYRPATEITGCNSLARVKRMIDLGIAEPEKLGIALQSLRLCTVLQSLLFSAPFAYHPHGSAFTASASGIAKGLYDCVCSGLPF